MGDLNCELSFEQEEKLVLAVVKVLANPTASEIIRGKQRNVLEGKQRAMGGDREYLEGVPDRVVGFPAGSVLIVTDRLDAG